MHIVEPVVHRRGRILSSVAAIVVVGAGSCTAVLTVSAGANGPVAAAPVASAATSVLASGDVVEATDPSVSADGRWIVVEGDAAGAEGDAGPRRTVYRSDRFTGETIELSPVPPGVRSGDSVRPRISRDGCVVVAQSEVPLDVFRDDDRGDRWDVYRLVLPECGGLPGAWDLVSVGADGTARDDVVPDDPATVSGSGAVVAYVHPAPGGPDGVSTITVVDVTLPVGDPARDRQVAGVPAEAPNTVFRYEGARQPALSSNGRHLAFRADFTASEALPGWGDGPVPGGPATTQVYVWDRFDAGSTPVHLVSGRDGVPSAAGSSSPAISEDGRVVVFVSPDRGLVTARFPRCAEACPTQIYRFDRDTDGNGIFDEPPRTAPLTIVSAVAHAPGDRRPVDAGDDSSWAPSLNIDGSQVAFVSDAGNLVTPRVPGGGEATDGDLVVAEVLLGTLHRVSDALTSSGIPGAHASPVLSDTGRVVVYETMVASAVTGDESLTGRRVVATPMAPKLSVAAADFGTVLVGWESEELYVSVLNDGPGAFAPATVTSSSRNFKITEGGTCRPGAVVPSGSSCTVFLTFNPTAPSTFRGTLTVAEAVFGGVSVSTTVEGVGGEPTLQVDPPGLDLDVGIVGSPGARRTIDVRNVSFAPTSVSSIRVVGANADDFSIVSQSCTNRALNPSVTCSVEVQFTPTAFGRRSALVQIGTPSGAYTAAIVSGEGRYVPSFETSATSVVAGDDIGIGGGGFPANSAIVIQLDDGGRPFAIARTNDAGDFLALVEIPSGSRPGPRALVAIGPDGVTAVAPIDVESQRTVAPGSPGVPGFGPPG
jgi:hypothetical protein